MKSTADVLYLFPEEIGYMPEKPTSGCPFADFVDTGKGDSLSEFVEN